MPCSQPTCVPVSRSSSRSQSTSDRRAGTSPVRAHAVHFNRDRIQLFAHAAHGLPRASAYARAQHARAQARPPDACDSAALACRSAAGIELGAASCATLCVTARRPAACRRAVRRGRETRAASSRRRPGRKLARAQRPSSSSATCAAAATIAKSPWRRLTSVNARARARLRPDRPAGFLPGIRPARARW